MVHIVSLFQIVLPQLQPLTDQQLLDFYNLRQSSQQAEDALSQGMDKLQQTLALSIAADQMSGESFGCQMASALEKLEALESFVSQVMHQIPIMVFAISLISVGDLMKLHIQH